MRIAIGGFQHESHSFAPRPTRWADFLNPGGFPPVQRPATLVAGTIAGRGNRSANPPPGCMPIALPICGQLQSKSRAVPGVILVRRGFSARQVCPHP